MAAYFVLPVAIGIKLHFFKIASNSYATFV
jgi:hypothetical protein